MEKGVSPSKKTTAGATRLRRVALPNHLPDYSEYRDEGCDLAPSCLQCNLPRCRLDIQSEGRRGTKALRDIEILRQHKLEKKSVPELARSYGVTVRTIYRIIRRASHE